jgi:hypothetical protein
MELYLQVTRLYFHDARVNVAVGGHNLCKSTSYFKTGCIFVSEMKLHTINYPKCKGTP